MRDGTAVKIRTGPTQGTWGAKVEGNPRPTIGDVIRVVRTNGWNTYERLARHVWSGKSPEGEIVRIYATVPASSDIGQVTVGEMKQVAEAIQEWGRLLVKGHTRRAGESMLDFGKGMAASYEEDDEENNPLRQKESQEDAITAADMTQIPKGGSPT